MCKRIFNCILRLLTQLKVWDSSSEMTSQMRFILFAKQTENNNNESSRKTNEKQKKKDASTAQQLRTTERRA